MSSQEAQLSFDYEPTADHRQPDESVAPEPEITDEQAAKIDGLVDKGFNYTEAMGRAGVVEPEDPPE